MIDPDTSSKLMVTTRIRGLIKGGSELAIGTLSQADALKLLAATAEVEEYAPMEGLGGSRGDGQYRMACEVVELCGCLALTVHIREQTQNAHGVKPLDSNKDKTCHLNGMKPLSSEALIQLL